MSLKLGTGLGVLAFVLVGSFYLNDINDTSSFGGVSSVVEGHRELASMQGTNSSNSSTFSNKFVTKLAESEGLEKAQLASRPSPFDRFAFEELQGRYSVELQSGKVRSFRFDALTHSDPLALPKPVEFLNAYKDLWSINFQNIKKSNVSLANKEIFDLSNKENQKVGSVIFQKDINGLWQSMEFIQE